MLSASRSLGLHLVMSTNWFCLRAEEPYPQSFRTGLRGGTTWRSVRIVYKSMSLRSFRWYLLLSPSSIMVTSVQLMQ